MSLAQLALGQPVIHHWWWLLSVVHALLAVHIFYPVHESRCRPNQNWVARLLQRSNIQCYNISATQARVRGQLFFLRLHENKAVQMLSQRLYKIKILLLLLFFSINARFSQTAWPGRHRGCQVGSETIDERLCSLSKWMKTKSYLMSSQKTGICLHKTCFLFHFLRKLPPICKKKFKRSLEVFFFAFGKKLLMHKMRDRNNFAD